MRQRSGSSAAAGRTAAPMGVGVVGCGGHAQGCNIPLAHANPHLRLVGLCDLQRPVLESLHEQYHPDFITTDLEQLVSDPRVELVICATKPDARWPVIEQAIKHRKALFLEKPLAFTAEDAIAMAQALTRSGIPTAVGFNRPYSPLMQALAPLYRRNRAGHTLMHYRIVGEAAVWPASHRHAVIQGHESTLVHEVTHIFDLFNWLTEELPTSVYTAGAGHLDNALVLTYGPDITASITAGDNGSVGYNKERFEINTNGCTLIGDMFVELLACGVDGGQRRCRRFPYEFAGKTRRTSAHTLAQHWWRWRRAVTPEQLAVGRYFGQTPSVDKGHAGQLEQFRRDIRARRPHATDAIRGALATLIAWQAIESWRTRSVVQLDHHWLRELRPGSPASPG